MVKRIYRSSTDKVFFGVCGGFAEYFSIDPLLIRVLWVLFMFFGGTGLIAYIIFGLVLPEQKENFNWGEGEQYYNKNEDGFDSKPLRHRDSNYIAGSVFVIIGIAMFGIMYFPTMLIKMVIPLGLIAVGILFFIGRR